MKKPSISDEVAYCAPMVTFLALTWAGGQWPSLYVASYVLKTLVVATMLSYFWRQFTPVQWTHWRLGIVVGVVGIVQWIGMQTWLQSHWEYFRPSENVFRPPDHFGSTVGLLAFYAVRISGAVLVVPVMEELFWRDFLWRTVSTRESFKSVPIGDRNLIAIAIVCAGFAMVHGNCWLTSVVWGAMIAGLLIYTRSIGACIVAHSVTNLLLAGYVLWNKDWSFW